MRYICKGMVSTIHHKQTNFFLSQRMNILFCSLQHLFHFAYKAYLCNLNGSWENIQVKLFEKCMCGSAKMGIFLYSMLMYWRNDARYHDLAIWVMKHHYILLMEHIGTSEIGFTANIMWDHLQFFLSLN